MKKTNLELEETTKTSEDQCHSGSKFNLEQETEERHSDISIKVDWIGLKKDESSVSTRSMANLIEAEMLTYQKKG